MYGRRPFKRSRSRDRERDIFDRRRERPWRNERDAPSRTWRRERAASSRFSDYEGPIRDRHDYPRSRSPVRERDYRRQSPVHVRERTADKEPPAGVIFMCSTLTKRDCFGYRVFGLPEAKIDLVERVIPGTKLFLFDFDRRELYGIFEAVSRGGLNLEPEAFRDFEGSYPAQVRFEIHRECLPLTEDIFGDAIQENYYHRNKFNFELTAEQVSKLIQLFCPIEPPRKKVDAAVRESPTVLKSGMRSNSIYDQGNAALPDNLFLEERRALQEKASIIHPLDSSLRGSQFPNYPPEFRVPAQAREREEVGKFPEVAPPRREMEEFRRLPEFAPTREMEDFGRFPEVAAAMVVGSAVRGDERDTLHMHRMLPNDGDYVDPIPPRANISWEQFQEHGSLHFGAARDEYPLVQSGQPYQGSLSNPAGLLEKSQIEEVDQLALKYLQTGPGFLDGSQGPLKGLPVFSLNPRRDHVDMRVQRFSDRESNSVYVGANLEQEPNLGYHQAEIAAAERFFNAAQMQNAGGRMMTREHTGSLEPLHPAVTVPATGSIGNTIDVAPSSAGVAPVTSTAAANATSSLAGTAPPSPAVVEASNAPTGGGAVEKKSPMDSLPLPSSNEKAPGILPLPSSARGILPPPTALPNVSSSTAAAGTHPHVSGGQLLNHSTNVLPRRGAAGPSLAIPNGTHIRPTGGGSVRGRSKGKR